MASEVPGNPGASSLHYAVIDPAGNDVYDFYPNYPGYGQSAPLLLSAGNYRVRVTYYYDYEGEYRLRATLAPSATYQVETEYNDAVYSANSPALTAVAIGGANHLQAQIAGAIVTGDGGDFYNLGNLVAGTAISLTESQASLSPLSAVLAVVNSSGNAVAPSRRGPAWARRAFDRSA